MLDYIVGKSLVLLFVLFILPANLHHLSIQSVQKIENMINEYVF